MNVDKYFQLDQAFVLCVSLETDIPDQPHCMTLLFDGRYRGPDHTDFDEGVLATFPPTKEGENFAIKVAQNINLFR